ncbi:MAG: DUF411 domain-containing protein [Balneolaceae bacterium]
MASKLTFFLSFLLLFIACEQGERKQAQQELYEMQLRQQVTEADVVMVPNPGCMCCARWASHLEENGFSVTLDKDKHPSEVKIEHGVEPELHSCHTALIKGYVIEGHVPAETIKKLLAEAPDATGLAVPGMPMGSPGMEGAYSETYKVILFDGDGNRTVFAQY